jgi:hypothetical protein
MIADLLATGRTQNALRPSGDLRLGVRVQLPLVTLLRLSSSAGG